MIHASRAVHLLAGSAGILLAACAAGRPSTAPAPEPQLQQYLDKADAFLEQHLEECRARYVAWDRRTAEAGRGDASTYRVAGHPYLRTERGSASFRNELADLETFWSWLTYLRDNDLLARESEMLALGVSKAERVDTIDQMRSCSKWVLDEAALDAVKRQAYIDAAAVPDEYAAGHPRLTPALSAAAAAQARAVQARFAAPLRETRRLHWAAAEPPREDLKRFLDAGFDGLAFDLLGRIDMLSYEWPALAALGAPRLAIETNGQADRFGEPRWTADGLVVDTTRPVIYWLPGYARSGGRMFWQFSYVAWFPGPDGRGAQGWVWRLTVNDAGETVAAESLRADGFEHLWYPGASAHARALPAAEAAMVAQPVPPQDYAVLLQSGTHAVQRLRPSTPADAVQRYELRPYEDLLALAAPGDTRRSLFDAQGFVADDAGTPLPGGAQAWADGGVPRPGVARQLERIAVSFTARRHFSDPYLLDTLFTLDPPPAAPTR